MPRFLPPSRACWSFLLGACVLSTHAQLTLQDAVVQGEAISAGTLFRATLHNAGPSTAVVVEGGVRTRAGETVVEFQSQPFTVPAGVSTLAAGQLTMRSFSYGPGEAGRNARLFQRLTGGEHPWCLRVRAVQDEGADEFCDVLHVEELLFLDLVMPWNGDTIEEVRPALTWTLSGTPAAVAAAEVRITVVPKPPGMDAAQALAANVPLYQVPGVRQRTLPHPPGVADLQRGRCYAWQAERVADDRVIDRSEPWAFCVRERLEPSPDKYVRLDRLQPGAVYRVTDRRIYFRYDEPYASPVMECSILSPDRQRIDPVVMNENTGRAVAGIRSAGVNLYELDLSPYALKPGIHTLEVRDGKGRRYDLRFEMPH